MTFTTYIDGASGELQLEVFEQEPAALEYVEQLSNGQHWREVALVFTSPYQPRELHALDNAARVGYRRTGQDRPVAELPLRFR